MEIRKSKYEIGIHHNKVDVQWDVRRIEKCNLVLAIYIASVVVYSNRQKEETPHKRSTRSLIMF